ncbi:hypothetical protein B0H14DRAFT_2688578 [Mycena olivaceomarginata]|nr:hypothetical protein B0H14DRAFT_2688578 [Mycena olivaceomarginata]
MNSRTFLILFAASVATAASIPSRREPQPAADAGVAPAPRVVQPIQDLAPINSGWTIEGNNDGWTVEGNNFDWHV